MRGHNWASIKDSERELLHACYNRGDGKFQTACGLTIDGIGTLLFGERCVECQAMLTRTRDWTDGELLLQERLYYCANGFSVAIVAVINPGIDWSAYIGGYCGDATEEATVRWIAKFGCKLPIETAALLFPQLPKRLYRP